MKCLNPKCRRKVSIVTVCGPCRRAGIRTSPPPVKSTGYLGEPEALVNPAPRKQPSDRQLDRWHAALVVMLVVTGLLFGLTLLASSAPNLASFN